MSLAKEVVDHFREMCSELSEPAICTDRKLNILFATESARAVFGLSGSDAKHLGCVFGQKYFSKLRIAVEDAKSISFAFQSAADKAHKKCTLVPVNHKCERYAVLLFSELSGQAADDLRRFELRHAVCAMEEKAEELTAETLRHLRLIDGGGECGESLRAVFRNMLRFRRASRNIRMLTETRGGGRGYIIDIAEYLKYVLSVTAELTGSAEVEYDMHLSDTPLYSHIDPFEFEVLICNILSNAIRFSAGPVKLTVTAEERETDNIVVITDRGAGIKDPTAMFSPPADISDAEFFGTGIAVINRIASENGGSAFAKSDLGRGSSFGFTLPKAEQDADCGLCTPESAEHNSRANILIGLSDVIDADNIKL